MSKKTARSSLHKLEEEHSQHEDISNEIDLSNIEPSIDDDDTTSPNIEALTEQEEKRRKESAVIRSRLESRSNVPLGAGQLVDNTTVSGVPPPTSITGGAAIRKSSRKISRTATTTINNSTKYSSMTRKRSAAATTTHLPRTVVGKDEENTSAIGRRSRVTPLHSSRPRNSLPSLVPVESTAFGENLVGDIQKSFKNNNSGNNSLRNINNTSTDNNNNNANNISNNVPEYNSSSKSNNTNMENHLLKQKTMSIASVASMRDLALQMPWHIILPESFWKQSWDIHVLLLLSYTAVMAPIRACFWVDAEGPLVYLELWIDIAFVLDMILIFRTAIVVKEMLVWDSKAIALLYFRTWFIVDLLASIPVDRMLDGAASSSTSVNQLGKLGKLPRLFKVLRLLRLLKLLRVVRLQAFLRTLETVYGLHAGFARLFKLILLMCIVTHVVACLWYLIPTLEVEISEESWIMLQGVEDATFSEQYIASVYWAFSTLTTVGYGDVSGRTQQERMFSIFVMALGVSWYAFIVSSMSSIMAGFDTHNATLREKINMLNSFMRDAKLPRDLRKRLRSHIEQVSFDKSNFYEADTVLAEMPATLRCEVLYFMNENLINQIHYFKGKTVQFAVRTVVCLRPLFVFSSDFIVQEGDTADEMFFLLKGRAAVIKEGIHIREITAGAHFGEMGCLVGNVRHATVQAVELCELYTLLKADLLQIVHEFPVCARELRDRSYLQLNEDAKRYRSILRVASVHDNPIMKQLAVINKFQTYSEGAEFVVPGASIASTLAPAKPAFTANDDQLESTVDARADESCEKEDGGSITNEEEDDDIATMKNEIKNLRNDLKQGLGSLQELLKAAAAAASSSPTK